SFENAIKPFSESGFKFMIAPGVSCWSQIYPSLSNAVVNISNYVRDGYRLGAMGMMNTCWDDDSENLFNYNWHGLTWGAECSWNPAKETEKAKATDERNAKLAAFNQSFDKVFYGLKEGSVTSLLFDMDKLRNLPIHGIMGDGAFWKNILEFYDEGNKQTVVSDNEKLIEETDAIIKGLNEMKEKARFNKATINYALFAAKRARFTGEKNIVTLSLQNAFTNNSTSDILAAQKAVAALKEKLGALRSEYVVLWNEENRGWWLDKVLAKYDELGNQLDALDKRVFITIGDKLPDNSFKVNLQTVYNDKPIYYTLDGTEPELTSSRYDGNLKISKPTFIRTRVIENKARYDISSKEILVHKALGCMKQLNSTYSGYSPAYSAGGMGALTDGIRGSENFADGHWQAFQGQDLNCVIDLKKVTDINEISIGFYQNTSSWILMPSKIEFYKSDDGVHFTLSEVVNNTIDPKTEGTVIHNFMTSKKMKARFVKVIACSIGKLPAWHPSAGTDSFIFADEIIIN
ncbi:MAG: chitobiase/beta-hexosaminidase C-terminal domain-containing protein, partial [Bacteroidota bacterium]|nr:chitobiase/beta-hexosaminidase C-terminal domain-containing protein [Bacteroidota bacterium]